MPIRHAGIFANRASTWPRDHFCRSTMAPRPSRPTTWNEFLPMSMPTKAIECLGASAMACSLSLVQLDKLFDPVESFEGRHSVGVGHDAPLDRTRVLPNSQSPKIAEDGAAIVRSASTRF